MFIVFTAPLALFILDIFFLGLFGLLFQLVGRPSGAALSRLWRHTTITFGVQLGLLLLLLLALTRDFALNSLGSTNFFALLIFSSAFVVPLALQIRHYRRHQP